MTDTLDPALEAALDPKGVEAARKAYAKRWMPDDNATFSAQAAAQVDYIIRAYLAARERHDSFEEKAVGYRAKDLARAAIVTDTELGK